MPIPSENERTDDEERAEAKVAQFLVTLGNETSSLGASIEMLLRQLPADAATLLRLGAIPHAVGRAEAAVLNPGLDPDSIDATLASLFDLSFVIRDGEVGFLHDEARRYLLEQWFESRNYDPERWQTFVSMNRRLAEHFAVRRRQASGEAASVAERSEIYHRIAAGEVGSFDLFRDRVRDLRLSYRREGCEALVAVVTELEHLLSDVERSWMRYYEALILIDAHRHGKAKCILQSILDDPLARDTIELNACSLLALQRVQRAEGQPKEALRSLEQLLIGLQGRSNAIPYKLEAKQNMAAVLLDLGEVSKAEQLLSDLLDVPELAKDVSLLAGTWNIMGILHRRLGRPRRALEAMEEALATLVRAGDPFRPMQIHNNIGLIHADQAEWEAARESLERALEIARKAGDLNGEANALGNLERVYLALDRSGEAIAGSERAIALLQTVHNWRDAGKVSGNLGRLYRRAGDKTEARTYFLKAANLFELAGDTKKADEYRGLADHGAKSWGLARWFVLLIGFVVLALAFFVLTAWVIALTY